MIDLYTVNPSLANEVFFQTALFPQSITEKIMRSCWAAPSLLFPLLQKQRQVSMSSCAQAKQLLAKFSSQKPVYISFFFTWTGVLREFFESMLLNLVSVEAVVIRRLPTFSSLTPLVLQCTRTLQRGLWVLTWISADRGNDCSRTTQQLSPYQRV